MESLMQDDFGIGIAWAHLGSSAIIKGDILSRGGWTALAECPAPPAADLADVSKHPDP